MNDETRSQPKVIVDVLRSTNGGVVSIDLLGAVLWCDPFYGKPECWQETVKSLIRTARSRLGVKIECVDRTSFVGFRLAGEV